MVRRLSIVAVALGLWFAVNCGPAPLKPRTVPADVPRLTVMTYNVNYGLSGDSVGLDAIEEADADLVFLQETTPRWAQAIEARFGERYPHQKWLVAGAAGGMGVLSRWPIAVELLRGPDWFDALRVEVETAIGPIEAISVHLRPQVSDGGSVVSGYFTTGSNRLAEAKAHAGHVVGNAPLLILGDFNEDEGGDAVEWLQERFGLNNAVMEFEPGADTWRWKTWAGEINATLDHILYTAARLEPLDAQVLRAGRSDHWPLVATFVIRRP